MKIPPEKSPPSLTSAPDHDVMATSVAILMTRLGKEFSVRGGVLPTGMLDELKSISLEGVDPEWQLERLQKIMERWLQSH